MKSVRFSSSSMADYPPEFLRTCLTLEFFWKIYEPGPAGRRVEEESLLQAIDKVRSLIDVCFPPGISRDMFRCNRNLEYLKRMSENQKHGLHQLRAIDETQQLIAAWFSLEPVKDIFTCGFILDNLRMSLARADRPTEGKESILHALEDAWESIYGWFPPGISKDMLKYNILLYKSRPSLIQVEWRGEDRETLLIVLNGFRDLIPRACPAGGWRDQSDNLSKVLETSAVSFETSRMTLLISFRMSVQCLHTVILQY